jgi:GTP-binding protein Era
VGIVSPVPQTTRNLIRAVITEPRGQIVFLDTPGMHKASNELGRVMNRLARRSVEGCDVILPVFDGSAPSREEDDGWIRWLARHGFASICLPVVNKADARERFRPDRYREIWKRIAAETGTACPEIWLHVSAEAGTGLDVLLGELFRRMPPHPQLFPADILSDFPRKLAVADVVREKLFGRLHDELPHAVAVQVEEIEEEPGGGWMVRGRILVDKPSQKPIVIGLKGRSIRAVRRASEAELSKIYERPVSVDLSVRVEKNWMGNHWILRQLGYVEKA